MVSDLWSILALFLVSYPPISQVKVAITRNVYKFQTIIWKLAASPSQNPVAAVPFGACPSGNYRPR